MQRNQEYEQTFSKIIASHRNQLSNKFAFSFHHKMICQVKNAMFARPPKIDFKDTKEVSTTASCQSQDITPCPASNNQMNTVKKVMHILNCYEEFLASHMQYDKETINAIRSDNRQLLAYVLTSKKDFMNLPRESIALAIILLNAEKIELNKIKLLDFIGTHLKISRITRLAQLRKSKAYSILSVHVKQPSAVPVWV